MKWMLFTLCLLFTGTAFSQEAYFYYRPYYNPPPVFQYQPYYITPPPMYLPPPQPYYPPIYQPYPTYVYGPRVWVHPKVYVEGQPVRNFFRAITP